MSKIYYTEDHEWLSVEGTEATVGITAHAAAQLGDVVFVELPDDGTEVAQGKEAAVVESVKAASEVFAPVTGTVTESNQALVDNPATVNDDAEGEGWFFRMTLTNVGELDDLMDLAAYKAFAGIDD